MYCLGLEYSDPELTCPLKSSGLEDYFPFEMAWFLGDMLVFGGVDGIWKYIRKGSNFDCHVRLQSVVSRPWPIGFKTPLDFFLCVCVFGIGNNLLLEYFLVFLFGFERCGSYSSIVFSIFQKYIYLSFHMLPWAVGVMTTLAIQLFK